MSFPDWLLLGLNLEQPGESCEQKHEPRKAVVYNICWPSVTRNELEGGVGLQDVNLYLIDLVDQCYKRICIMILKCEAVHIGLTC